jgi:hypothetical protein
LNGVKVPGSPFRVNAIKPPKKPTRKSTKRGLSKSLSKNKEKRCSSKDVESYILPSRVSNPPEFDLMKEKVARLQTENFELQEKYMEEQKKNLTLQHQILELNRQLAFLQSKDSGETQSPSKSLSLGDGEAERKLKRCQDKLQKTKNKKNEIETQLKKEQKKHRCRVCTKNMREAMVLPCRHAIFCSVCISRMDKCIICGSSLRGFIKLNLQEDVT